MLHSTQNFIQDASSESETATTDVSVQIASATDVVANFDVQNFVDTYALPWGINIVLAIIIYIIGKMVVGILVNVFGKIMAKSKYDDMLVDFLKSIVKAVLMLFVIVASLDQLGV